MRKFMDILEDIEASTAQTLLLFRGDSASIAEFQIEKTDLMALFGRGIYLTDNKRVAGDYKTKGTSAAGDVLYRTRAKTQKDVIRSYAESLAKTIDANGVDHSKEIAFWSRAVPYSDGGDYGVMTSDLRRNEHAQRLQYALERIKSLLKTYEVRVKLDGTALIQKKQGGGTITQFAVPASYAAKTIRADQEIPEKVLSVITYHLKKADDRSTAQDIETHVREQSREYGQNPTFREIFTSITGDSPLIHDESVHHEMIDDFVDLGYTGVHYVGGVSMGGGYKHNAYVFWDAAAINGCRVK